MGTKKTAPAAPEPESFDQVLRNFQRSISLVVDSQALGNIKSISQVADDIAKNHQKLLLSISKSMPKFDFPSATLFLPTLQADEKQPAAKLIGGSDVQVTGHVEPKQKQIKKQFSLYFIQGHSIKFKGKTLRAFSLETQHGLFLKMLLDAEDHFVSDEILLATFGKDHIHEISHIRRNLRNAFKENHLNIIIDRKKVSKGYLLIDIQKID